MHNMFLIVPNCSFVFFSFPFLFSIVHSAIDYAFHFRVDHAMFPTFAKKYWIPFPSLFPLENIGNPGTNLDLESMGVWGNILIVNFKKRRGRKFRTFILLRFGFVTFRIHFGKARQVIIFMFSGLGGVVHDSPNKLCIILDASHYFK